MKIKRSPAWANLKKISLAPSVVHFVKNFTFQSREPDLHPFENTFTGIEQDVTFATRSMS